MPDQACPVISDLQAVVPAVMLHGEERSSPGDCNVWSPRNLPGPGRSSPLNLHPACAGPAPVRCTTASTATSNEPEKPQLTAMQNSAAA